MRRPRFLLVVLALGLAFLYLPILLLVVYSFNASRLVTLWGGFSTRWYAELMGNQQLLSAAWLSLRIAAISATGAVVLGTLAGMAMARFGRFRGRAIFGGLVTAPLVMPEVITGLSLLLLFVSLEELVGWPEGRGMTTIVLAHVTFTMAFVTVIVQSRMASLDESIEEAAMDLGARPAKVFFVITLPIIAPAVVSGWLLAFTLSLDDVVIANFVSGPGATTLPIEIFSSVRLGVTPEINALATIIVGLVTAGIALAGFVGMRQERARRRDEQMAQQSNAREMAVVAPAREAVRGASTSP
jgi:putrescine transport system permease protein